ncbi:hypothetical protein [Aliivibrio wodanis]
MTLFEFTITTNNITEFLLNFAFVVACASFCGCIFALWVFFSWRKNDA